MVERVEFAEENIAILTDEKKANPAVLRARA
jgi:hypothetical protein